MKQSLCPQEAFTGETRYVTQFCFPFGETKTLFLYHSNYHQSHFPLELREKILVPFPKFSQSSPTHFPQSHATILDTITVSYILHGSHGDLATGKVCVRDSMLCGGVDGLRRLPCHIHSIDTNQPWNDTVCDPCSLDYGPQVLDKETLRQDQTPSLTNLTCGWAMRLGGFYHLPDLSSQSGDHHLHTGCWY